MWMYQGKEFKRDDIKDHIGFVYIIRHIASSRYYIGQKKFTFTKTLPPLKGRTHKRKITTISDYESYYGSSEEVKALVLKDGKDAFTREIIHLCNTKSEMNFLEAYMQIQHNVLFDAQSFNGIINMRVSRKHVGKSEICQTLSNNIIIQEGKDE